MKTLDRQSKPSFFALLAIALAVALVVAGIFSLGGRARVDAQQEHSSAQDNPPAPAGIASDGASSERVETEVGASVAGGPQASEAAANDDATNAQPKHSESWLQCLRNKDLVRSILRIPHAVTARRYVVRNADLNLTDRELSDAEIHEVEAICKKWRDRYEVEHAAHFDLCSDRHLGLERKGLLKPLTIEDVPESERTALLERAKVHVERAQSIGMKTTLERQIGQQLMSHGSKWVHGFALSTFREDGLYISTWDQLGEDCKQKFAELFDIQRSWLYELLGWFIEHGYTTTEAAMPLAERFEALLEAQYPILASKTPR